MDILVLKNYYEKRGASGEETEAAVKTFSVFLKHLEKTGKTINKFNIEDMKRYIETLTESGENTVDSLIALARASYLAGNNDLYIYFTQIVERENIISNMRDHIEESIGKELTDSIYNNLQSPPTGSPPESAVDHTKKLVEALQSELSEKECRKALTANAHGIPKEAFKIQREKFLAADSLRSYLDNFHMESVKTLTEHAESGKVWFEQTICRKSVEYVRNNKEVLGGVLEGNKIFWTKIPFNVTDWLKEKDPDKRRYLACHCPVAREALNKEKIKIPKAWCHCTSGYIQQRFNAIFDKEVDVECLESVLDGDDVCRFAITVPGEFL